MIGQLVGHYRILEKIGSGGMGEVYRARDERLGRDVALKLIRPASSNNPDHLRRFEQEARAAAALNHPNILAIYDVGFEGTNPYIVSELLEGVTLRQHLAQGPIPVREATDHALQITHALTAAHARHIVHRDLKPENLFLTTEGRIKILDFGVAKLQATAEENRSVETLTTVTKSGAVVGTVAYMSPEQLRSKPVDHRSDIFSFGAILYEMLTGCRAFRGETEVDTMTAVLREQPSEARLNEAEIPAPYKEVIQHCLEKEPEDRFQSAKDLAFALQTISGSSPGREVPFLRPQRARSRVLPWALAGIMAATTAVLALAVWMRSPSAALTYRRLTFEAGTVYAARFAADGQSIIYGAAWNGKPVQLFSTVGNSLLAQPLGLTDANLLAVSRTNELAVALHGTHNGQLETIDGMLATAPLAGGSPREVLADVQWADFDPNGGLAVVHYADGHSRLEYPSNNVLYQTAGWISDLRFSPQGDQIAFIDHPALWDDRGAVCVIDFSGHLTHLTENWESAEGLAWRPDGKEVWFTAAEKGNHGSLMGVTLSGKTRTLLVLPSGLTLQDIASDGRALVALHSKRLAMAASSLNSAEDVDLSWHDWNIAKAISRDGRFVLFEDASEAAGPSYAVALRRLDGALPVRLGEGSAGGLSPDGKWAISFPMTNPAEIALLPIGPGQPRIIKPKGLQNIHNGWARFLPDQHSILVNASEPGHGDRCYLVALDDHRPRPLTPEGTRCGPSSPDGHNVIGVGPAGAIAVYGLDGGQPRSVPVQTAGFLPVQWSNDNRFLYGYRDGEIPGQIYKVAIDTGKASVIHQLRPNTPAGVVTISPVVVSRDGARFAYSYNQTLSVLYLISGLK
jgi:eukaryotic-like serine/threonine-protein kinase